MFKVLRIAYECANGPKYRAPSADGARYANAGESSAFWNRGNTAFVTEGGPTRETYGGCIVR